MSTHEVLPEQAYLDIKITIRDGRGPNYTVTVDGPDGAIERDQAIHLAYSEEDVEQLINLLEMNILRSSRIRKRAIRNNKTVMRDFGSAVYRQLMSPKISKAFVLYKKIANDDGKRLRLRLIVEPSHLAALPWELLYDEELNEFVCLSVLFRWYVAWLQQARWQSNRSGHL